MNDETTLEEDAAKIVGIIVARLEARGSMTSDEVDDLLEMARIKFRHRR
jgi:hypothetical protein